MTPDLPAIYTLLDGMVPSQWRDVLYQMATADPERFEMALKDSELLRQAAESVAPYGAKHGHFDAATAADVAHDVPGPHLAEHKNGSTDCTKCRGPHRDGPLAIAPCLVPAAHFPYPNGSVDCDVPGHHAEVFNA